MALKASFSLQHKSQLDISGIVWLYVCMRPSERPESSPGRTQPDLGKAPADPWDPDLFASKQLFTLLNYNNLPVSVNSRHDVFIYS